ncbi:MAG: AAA family ATPase [Treponema sp.]|nr:AAA family ATPase [Treponema sp.]
MFLSNIKLWNFRRFGSDETTEIFLDKPNLDLQLKEGINVLVGENDSGKTAIIDAIRLVLKTQDYEWYRITDEDFYKTSNRFRIELRFDKLADEEAKNFIEWISYEDDATSGGKRFYLRLIYDVERNESRIFPSDICAGTGEKGYPLTAEAKDYLRVTYLKPLRDATTELAPGKYSRLSSILFSSEVFDKGLKTTELETQLLDFNHNVETFFSDNTKEGYIIKKIIDDYIQQFINNTTESTFSFSSTDIKNILTKLELQICNEINPGLGTLNRLYMAAELLNLKRGNWNGLRLGLIEELEAHLHPQAQMKVIEKLSDSYTNDNIQLILTTHSPNIASKLQINDLIICIDGKCYPLGENYTNLEKQDYIFLQEFLDVTKANLFFAKGLIFVEGWAEQIVLSSFANFLKNKGIISKSITEAGVSIINVGSVAFLRYTKIFQRKDSLDINIPISIITDSDIRVYEKINDTITKRPTKVIESELSEKITESEKKFNWKSYIKVFLAEKWTFEYALYSSKTFSQVFQEIVKNIHKKTDWSNFEPKLAEKLIEQTLDKTRIAYKLNNEINTNESLIALKKEDIESDKAISYLVEAIKFVCK